MPETCFILEYGLGNIKKSSQLNFYYMVLSLNYTGDGLTVAKNYDNVHDCAIINHIRASPENK